MALVVTCPACQRRLQVPDDLVGQDVQCPECELLFTAAVGVPPSTAIGTQAPAPGPAAPEWENPPAKPTSRPDRWADPDEDDDHQRPVRRVDRGDYAPHRGAMILTFGILSLVGAILFALFCGIFCVITAIFGGLAWTMGGQDLEEIRTGRMDPDGESLVTAGRILGLVGAIISGLVLLMFCVVIGFVVVGVAAHRN